jgi:Crp-like helix-turn-helix domain
VSGRSFRLPLTPEEIADHVGLTAVHVNRVLGRLRRTVVLADFAALCRMAGQDAAVVEQEPTRKANIAPGADLPLA